VSNWANKRQTPAEQARRKKYNGRAHREAGKHWTAQVAAGTAHCWRCGRHIPPGTPRGTGWVVGHDDHNVNLIRGAECYPCNKRAADRKGARVANAQRNGRPRPRVQPPTQVTPLRW
jgi:hypothetical protein